MCAEEERLDCNIKYEKAKLLQIFSVHAMFQEGSFYWSVFKWLSGNYNWKLTPGGLLHAEKIALAVLLYVFRISFTEFLLPKYVA